MASRSRPLSVRLSQSSTEGKIPRPTAGASGAAGVSDVSGASCASDTTGVSEAVASDTTGVSAPLFSASARSSMAAIFSASSRFSRSRSARACESDRLTGIALEVRLAAAERSREAGDFPATRRHLEAVLAAAPGHPEATLESAELSLRDGDRDRAIRLLSEALAHHPADERLIEAAADVLARP